MCVFYPVSNRKASAIVISRIPQLAQMLYEVPHHSFNPSREEFALKQLTLPQAEEIAQEVKALADGK